MEALAVAASPGHRDCGPPRMKKSMPMSTDRALQCCTRLPFCVVKTVHFRAGSESTKACYRRPGWHALLLTRQWLRYFHLAVSLINEVPTTVANNTKLSELSGHVP